MRIAKSIQLAFLLGLSGTLANSIVAAEPPAPATASAEPKKPSAKKLPSQAELEKQFAEQMTGATFVGHFTMGEVTPDTKLKTDRYTISKATKLEDDFWMLQTRIQYGDHDLTLPIPLRVLWAGDTPVITLDDAPIPGLGTFNARVLIFGNEYAGTWGCKDYGGCLFGKIVKEVKK